MMYFVNILVLLVAGLSFGIGFAMVWEPLTHFISSKYLRPLVVLRKPRQMKESEYN